MDYLTCLPKDLRDELDNYTCGYTPLLSPIEDGFYRITLAFPQLQAYIYVDTRYRENIRANLNLFITTDVCYLQIGLDDWLVKINESVVVSSRGRVTIDALYCPALVQVLKSVCYDPRD